MALPSDKYRGRSGGSIMPIEWDHQIVLDDAGNPIDRPGPGFINQVLKMPFDFQHPFLIVENLKQPVAVTPTFNWYALTTDDQLGSAPMTSFDSVINLNAAKRIVYEEFWKLQLNFEDYGWVDEVARVLLAAMYTVGEEFAAAASAGLSVPVTFIVDVIWAFINDWGIHNQMQGSLLRIENRLTDDAYYQRGRSYAGRL